MYATFEHKRQRLSEAETEVEAEMVKLKAEAEAEAEAEIVEVKAEAELVEVEAEAEAEAKAKAKAYAERLAEMKAKRMAEDAAEQIILNKYDRMLQSGNLDLDFIATKMSGRWVKTPGEFYSKSINKALEGRANPENRDLIIDLLEYYSLEQQLYQKVCEIRTCISRQKDGFYLYEPEGVDDISERHEDKTSVCGFSFEKGDTMKNLLDDTILACAKLKSQLGQVYNERDYLNEVKARKSASKIIET